MTSSTAKLRLVFILVAAAVLVPLLLLVDRALSSAEAELAIERRTLAERLIDEMERELTAFLRREEDRPFAHYRYLARPDDLSGAAFVRSPMAEGLEPFVVGPFQIGPDGVASTPLWPDDERLARIFADWRPDPALRDRADRVLAAIRPTFLPRPGAGGEVQNLSFDRLLAEDDQPGQQRAGTTIDFKNVAEPKSAGSASPLELLEKLNRGAGSRADRISKQSKTQAENLMQRQSPSLVDLRLEPMVGRALPDGKMVLYRTVLAGQSGFRQGLYIDSKALVDWLADKALGAAQRNRLRVAAAEVGAAELSPSGAVFRHRFAEPFAPAVALVTVEPGIGGASLRTARQLSALLVAAVLLGLFAVYRMAAFAVAYAQRRSDFVAAVTHELKTPLTAIRLYGEMLRDGMVNDEAKKQRYYQTIIAEGERLSRLVDNVLELARLERREKVARLEAGQLGPILQEALALLQPHAEKEGFTLALELEGDLPAVKVDRDALLQVIFNLIDNAIKYAKEAESKVITIAARREGNAVVATVADRGPGVAPRQLRRIFEPFWRGENELTRRTKGTGIGLALVKGLVERMGGQIAARSEGRGLEVDIRLALAE